MIYQIEKTIKKILPHVLVFSVLFIPILASAQQSGLAKAINDCEGGDCGWPQFIGLIDSVVGFIVTLGLAFSVIVMLYAGSLYLFSGGDSGKISQAHEMFKKVAIGIVVMLLAYSLVKLLAVTTLGLQPEFLKLQ